MTALAIIGVLVAIWAVSNTNRIMDQVAVWQYSPSPTIEGYAEATTMTEEGRFLFFASRPMIADAAEFDAQCGIEQSVGAIGCYRPDFRTIFLYDLGPGFENVEQVTAAHELLHAVWDRLSDAEQNALEPLLEAEAAKRADDPEWIALMAQYAQIEPGERTNELHSFVGSEFSQISPELEAHYARYFEDREALVALSSGVVDLGGM
ncbi:hypothetical protein [Antiquaquibacter soli]|uniref:Uncharacterized protein n=1 Tax=Antiquaquibacter soli TaxID=3064523 RepID=A0ABT9BQ29_9MICO|nr:hypothetical protein [Protaetiibacter sp. WY-16]MDO7881530.1 hypothetical protein [Protaetiibacter sp. WY-16]